MCEICPTINGYSHLPNTTDETTLNIPEMRKLVEWVEAEAELPDEQRKWSQAYWYCGSTYCAAGFVALSHGWTPYWVTSSLFLGGEREAAAVHRGVEQELQAVGKVAGAILGLTRGQAHRLFFGGNTSQEIREFAEEICGERL